MKELIRITLYVTKVKSNVLLSKDKHIESTPQKNIKPVQKNICEWCGKSIDNGNECCYDCKQNKFEHHQDNYYSDADSGL